MVYYHLPHHRHPNLSIHHSHHDEPIQKNHSRSAALGKGDFLGKFETLEKLVCLQVQTSNFSVSFQHSMGIGYKQTLDEPRKSVQHPIEAHMHESLLQDETG